MCQMAWLNAYLLFWTSVILRGAMLLLMMGSHNLGVLWLGFISTGRSSLAQLE
jgi:hypothetical protein